MADTPTQSPPKPKKYFWLKLKEGFFDDKNIKLMRKMENGDTLVLVYLMMQCKALKSDGMIDYRQILPSIDDEIALDIGVEPEIVKKALVLMERLGLIERLDNDAVALLAKEDLIVVGSESESAERMRRMRERKRKGESVTK